ncbi:MAG: ATP-binding protein [Salinivirgaceae bacterium]|nr:ATP-binding protein [Salinivirgaceae bacterium]
MGNENEIELNIQPQAGVIGVFSRLNYKAWYAIGEFVDNSTQSFYSHQEELKQNGIKDVIIDIKYDSEQDILTIADTAFGMELTDFSRAVKVDSPPEDKNGRNEFGMGLKTAASWFGNIWSVRSTQLGSTNEYYTEINIPEMREKNINTVAIHRTQVSPNTHGTTIVISEITKKIGAPRTKTKIVDLLKSMYRRDLNSGLIHIYYDSDPLLFDDYACLTFRNQEWKKNLDFRFDFDGIEHHITGFVGILANGGFGRAGFALFRRNRVVIGGEEQNYKPDRIFGQAQSTIAHKLFGELDLDDFPINQAKDGFVWDDGLEEMFVTELRRHIKEYIDIAKLTNKERAREEDCTPEVSHSIRDQVQKTIQDSFGGLFDCIPTIEELDTQGESEDVIRYKEYQKAQNNLPNKEDNNKREYKVPLDAANMCTITVNWIFGDSTTYWIKVDPSEDGTTASVQLNINHPFFKPFSEQEKFKEVLEKFALAFALSELQVKKNARPDGSVSPGAFRNLINQYLTKLAG